MWVFEFVERSVPLEWFFSLIIALNQSTFLLFFCGFGRISMWVFEFVEKSVPFECVFSLIIALNLSKFLLFFVDSVQYLCGFLSLLRFLHHVNVLLQMNPWSLKFLAFFLEFSRIAMWVSDLVEISTPYIRTFPLIGGSKSLLFLWLCGFRPMSMWVLWAQ